MHEYQHVLVHCSEDNKCAAQLRETLPVGALQYYGSETKFPSYFQAEHKEGCFFRFKITSNKRLTGKFKL